MASPSSLSLLSLSLFILLSSHPIIFAADDTLSSGNSLATNQTLTSVGKNFVLGFFTPGNSSNRYIGIWYSQIQIPEKTVVWVANRETPLKDPAGVFTISGDGNLVILDGKKSIVWSANISAGAQRNTSAVLSDSGNFVLTDDSGTVLWESFSNPTDTYLPGMKFRLNRQTRETKNLVSWKSSDDPSPGKVSAGIDPIIPLQIVMWSGSDRIWRSGRWTGDIFGGSLKTNRSLISYLTVIATEKEISFTVAVSDTIVSRLVVTEAGRIQQLSLVSQKWQVIWWKPKSPCEFYNRCGTSGVCDEYSVPKVCECLRGHVPKVQREWEAGNNSAGCVRRTSLGCNEGDGFFKMGKIKVPDLSTVVANVSQDECQARCLRNCSCGAYAYDDLTGLGCIVWGVDLLDVEENYATGLDFYVRLPQSELSMFQEKDGKGSSNGKKRLLSILLPILGAVILVACIFACFMRKRNQKQGKVKGSKLPEWAVNKVAIDLKDSNNLGEGGDNPELPLFSFSSVVAATDNFSPANKLGQGGFGPVYKGRLPEGQEIAVKRLSKKSGQGLEEFRNELLVIAKLQHRNLVRLLGWSIHQEEKILIYEYMPNKSLDKFLFDPTKKGLLDWGTRFRIIEGIAQGLLYLHTYSRLKIIHRDMKSGNILLDSEMNPKISDFGMARIFEGDQTEANTNRVVGTYGYMSPEYALDGLFSEKSDVFSFGVLLLEIVSGKKNTGFYQSTENLVGQAWRLWSEGRSMELMDPSLGDMCVRQQVERCIHVGLLCIQEDAGDRPTMSLAVMMLGDENTTLPPPKQSGFTAGRAPPTDVETDNHSVNEMSVSTITPR